MVLVVSRGRTAHTADLLHAPVATSGSSRVCVLHQVRAWLFMQGVYFAVNFPASGFTVPSRVCPGTMPNSSVQSVAVYHVVQCLLASKEWLLRPGVPGAWPRINMVGHWHCVGGNVGAASMAAWCLRQWQDVSASVAGCVCDGLVHCGLSTGCSSGS